MRWSIQRETALQPLQFIVVCAPPSLSVDQWGACFGKHAAAGGAQSASGDGGLVLGGGLRHLSDRLHGREDQAEHTPGTELLNRPGSLRSSEFIINRFSPADRD